MIVSCPHNWTVTSECPKCLRTYIEQIEHRLRLMRNEAEKLIDEKERQSKEARAQVAALREVLEDIEFEHDWRDNLELVARVDTLRNQTTPPSTNVERYREALRDAFRTLEKAKEDLRRALEPTTVCRYCKGEGLSPCTCTVVIEPSLGELVTRAGWLAPQARERAQELVKAIHMHADGRTSQLAADVLALLEVKT